MPIQVEYRLQYWLCCVPPKSTKTHMLSNPLVTACHSAKSLIATTKIQVSGPVNECINVGREFASWYFYVQFMRFCNGFVHKVMFPWILAQWEEYHTSQMVYNNGYWGGTEMIYGATVFHFLTAAFGGQIWTMVLFNIAGFQICEPTTTLFSTLHHQSSKFKKLTLHAFLYPEHTSM